jgi:hypothetical protein
MAHYFKKLFYINIVKNNIRQLFAVVKITAPYCWWCWSRRGASLRPVRGCWNGSASTWELCKRPCPMRWVKKLITHCAEVNCEVHVRLL